MLVMHTCCTQYFDCVHQTQTCILSFVVLHLNYRASLAIWDHIILPPLTQVNTPRLNPRHRQAGTGTRFTYPIGMEFCDSCLLGLSPN